MAIFTSTELKKFYTQSMTILANLIVRFFFSAKNLSSEFLHFQKKKWTRESSYAGSQTLKHALRFTSAPSLKKRFTRAPAVRCRLVVFTPRRRYDWRWMEMASPGSLSAGFSSGGSSFFFIRGAITNQRRPDHPTSLKSEHTYIGASQGGGHVTRYSLRP